MNNSPIGVFDSGLGGLSVWREIRKSLPEESLVYFGDGKNCPYGGRPKQEVREFTDNAVRWLVEQRGAKLVVVACNTATAAAIDYVRERYSIPIVGMEPAVKPAALSTRSGVIAILATKGSFEGELYRRTAAQYGAGIRILPTVGRGFVELVEENKEDTEEAFRVVSSVVEPLIEQGADRIVLGCTHYPFLARVIRRVIAGRGVELVDSAPAVEKRVEHLLGEFSLRAEKGNRPEYEFYTLAGEEYRKKLMAKSELAIKEEF